MKHSPYGRYSASNGNVLPLAMNRKLSDAQIRATCSELFAVNAGLTGRGLRAELRQRFGYSGRTDRVFAIWRSQRNQPQSESGEPGREGDIGARLAGAEARVRGLESERDRAEERARRSEARELAHQDRWANEIHELRAIAHRLQGEEVLRRRLEERVLQLHRERHELQLKLAQLQSDGAKLVARQAGPSY